MKHCTEISERPTKRNIPKASRKKQKRHYLQKHSVSLATGLTFLRAGRRWRKGSRRPPRALPPSPPPHACSHASAHVRTHTAECPPTPVPASPNPSSRPPASPLMPSPGAASSQKLPGLSARAPGSSLGATSVRTRPSLIGSGPRGEPGCRSPACAWDCRKTSAAQWGSPDHPRPPASGPGSRATTEPGPEIGFHGTSLIKSFSDVQLKDKIKTGWRSRPCFGEARGISTAHHIQTNLVGCGHSGHVMCYQP